MKKSLSYAVILMVFMYHPSDARISVPLSLKKKVQQIKRFSDSKLSILKRGMQGKTLNAQESRQFNAMKKALGATAIAVALGIGATVGVALRKSQLEQKKVGFVDQPPEVTVFEREEEETQQQFGKDAPEFKKLDLPPLGTGPSPEGQKRWESEIAYIPESRPTTMLPGLELSKDERLITQAWLRDELEDDVYEEFDRVKDLYDAKKMDFAKYGTFTQLIMKYINKEIDKEVLNKGLAKYK